MSAAFELRLMVTWRLVYALGERPPYELVRELARHHGITDESLAEAFERYAAADPVILRALGGDRLPLFPLRAIGGGGKR